MEDDEGEDIELGDLDLNGIEHACMDKEKGYVPAKQFKMLQEAIIRAISNKNLGIRETSSKYHKRNSKKLKRNREYRVTSQE